MLDWLQRLFSGKSRSSAGDHSTPAPRPAAAAPAAARVPSPPARPAPRPVVSFDQLDRVNHLYNQWLFDTVGDAAFDTSELEVQVLDALTAIVNARQSGEALVRRMPGMLPQLLQSLRSDNFSGAQLARTISGDVVLVAAVIRMANNSLTGTGTQIASVEHAVVLRNLGPLRSIVERWHVNREEPTL